MERTFAIGDIHGDLAALEQLLGRLPSLTADDTIVFIGDYVDRGPRALEVIDLVRTLPRRVPARVIVLRGNHEQLWLEFHDAPVPGLMLRPRNGFFATYLAVAGARAGNDAREELSSPQTEAAFLDVKRWFPPDLKAWMESLPLWYEDAHAIYVHGGLQRDGDRWLHPRDSTAKHLLWLTDRDMLATYRGKPVVFGHTRVGLLQELAPSDDRVAPAWSREPLFGIDTGAGKGGFLSAIEFPARTVFSSDPIDRRE